MPTPLGTFNPDWAVLIQSEDGERLYFVVETRGGMFTDDLGDREIAKIECGKARFKALRMEISMTVDPVATGAGTQPPKPQRR